MKKTTNKKRANTIMEIKSPEEFMKRFKSLVVSISTPEQFIKTVDLLEMVEIDGALVYTTKNKFSRGTYISYWFDKVQYDEESQEVSFAKEVKLEVEKDNILDEFVLPVEEIETANGFISNEDDGQGDFYCLKLETAEAIINICWRL